MGNTSAAQELIDKYLRLRGYRQYRAEDGECLITVASEVGAFWFYLRESCSARAAMLAWFMPTTW